MLNVKRGELYYADLSPVVGSEQGGIRPILIVQNDVGNKYSPTIIAAAVTTFMFFRFFFGMLKNGKTEQQG